MNQKNKADLHLDVEFRNLGKIQKANIQLRPFTVIAGCNASGKSFITKSLYSLFSFNIVHSNDLTKINNLFNQLGIKEQDQIHSRLRGKQKALLRKDGRRGFFPEYLSILSQNFLDNFMAQNLGSLINFSSKKSSIKIKNIDEIKISKENISITLSSYYDIRSLNPYPPIYLESPIYWKLTDALKSSKVALDKRAIKRGLDKNDLVNQVPKYFFDVLELLEEPVKSTTFDDIAEMLEKAINGNLSISNGNIQFRTISTRSF